MAPFLLRFAQRIPDWTLAPAPPEKSVLNDEKHEVLATAPVGSTRVTRVRQETTDDE